MTFMTITIKVFKKEYNIDYSPLGVLLVFLIIFTLSFAYGFNTAEGYVAITLTDIAIQKNDTAWKLLAENQTDLATKQMDVALEMCVIYLSYPFQGHFDIGLYKEMFHRCNEIFESRINLQRVINPNQVIRFGNTTVNLSKCSYDYRRKSSNTFFGDEFTLC